MVQQKCHHVTVAEKSFVRFSFYTAASSSALKRCENQSDLFCCEYVKMCLHSKPVGAGGKWRVEMQSVISPQPSGAALSVSAVALEAAIAPRHQQEKHLDDMTVRRCVICT